MVGVATPQMHSLRWQWYCQGQLFQDKPRFVGEFIVAAKGRGPASRVPSRGASPAQTISRGKPSALVW
eukprot:11227958-Lingulodinium_polyedra.AAC.1